MANTFNPVIEYKAIIDEYFEKADITNVFTGTADYIGNGEYKILKVSVGGLGNYTRHRSNSQGSSFADNSLHTEWETIKATVERSTQLSIDKMDNLESFSLAFDQSIKQFLQHAVVERMARRHSAIATDEKVKKEYETIASAEDTIKSLRKVSDYMDDKWVSKDNRVLIIRSNMLSALADLDTYKSQLVLDGFGTIIPVPSEVMNSKITLTDDGFDVDEDSMPINYIVAQKDAIITGNYWEAQYFDEGSVQNFLGSIYNYFEKPLDAYIYDNKADGVYVSLKGTAPAADEEANG